MTKIHIGDMSHKKAIEILKDMLEAMNVYQGISPRPERINAVKMGIEALEQEPKTGHCRDCKYYHTAWDGTETYYYESYWCEWADPNENDFCSLYEAKEEVSE